MASSTKRRRRPPSGGGGRSAPVTPRSSGSGARRTAGPQPPDPRRPPSIEDRIAWGATVAAVGVVPAVFWRAGTNPFALVKSTVLAWCVVVGLAAWLVGRIRRGREARVPWPAAALPTAVLLALVVAATVASPVPEVSLHGAYSRYSGLAGTLLLAGVALLVVAGAWRRPARLRHLVVAAGVAAGVEAAYVLLATAGIDLDWAGAAEATGTYGNRLFSAGHLAIVLPLVVLLAVTATDRRERVAWLTVGGLSLVALVLLDARGSLLALVVGTAVTGLLSPRLVPRPLALGASVLAVGGVALILAVVATGSTSWLGPVAELPVLRSATLLGRADLWEGSLGMIADRPLLGWGPDAFVYAFPPYAPPEMTGRPFPVDKSHDILLERAAESGLPALAAYLWLVGSVVTRAVRRRRELDEPEQLLVAAFTGSFAAYLAQGLTGIDLLPLALLGVVPLAALVVLTDPRVAEARAALDGQVDGPAEASPARRALALLPVPLALVALVLVTRPFAADVAFRRATEDLRPVHSGVKRVDDLLRDIEAAIALDPWEPRLYQMGLVKLNEVASVDPAAADLATLRLVDEGLALAPDDLGLLQARGTTLGRMGRWDESDRIFLDMEQRDPWDPAVRLVRAEALLARSRAGAGPVDALREEARREVDTFVRLRPESWAPGWVQAAAVYQALGDVGAARSMAEHALALDPATPGARELLAELQGG